MSTVKEQARTYRHRQAILDYLRARGDQDYTENVVDSLPVSPSQARGHVAALVKQGYLRREKDPRRRSVLYVNSEENYPLPEPPKRWRPATKCELQDALKELVALKDLKDTHGKTPEYLARLPKAWKNARALLESMQETKQNA